MTSNKDRAKRVTVVCGALNGGGAERVVIDLCRHLRDNDREVTLVSLTSGADAYEAPSGIARVRLDVRRKSPTLFHTFWNAFKRSIVVRRNILRSRPDVVVTFIDRINIVTLISLFGTGIPVIVSERIHPGYNPIERAWLILRKWVYPFANVVTVQTNEGADWLRRHIWFSRPVVMPNAIRQSEDLGEGILSRPTDGPFILAVGRFDKQKGFDLLLEAFRQTGLASQGWSLVILGEGPEGQALKEQADRLGIGQATVFPGFCKVGPWLRAADIFVMSSRYEGFPNALLEAMQLGCACVSFDCPSGPRDLIESGKNGLLVPPQDVGALSKAICSLASDTSLRERLAAEAQAVQQKFNVVSIYTRWINLIDATAPEYGRMPLVSRRRTNTP